MGLMGLMDIIRARWITSISHAAFLIDVWAGLLLLDRLIRALRNFSSEGIHAIMRFQQTFEASKLRNLATCKP